jgi:hypothetical protein
MAVQNPPVKGGFEPPVMSFSAVVYHGYLLMNDAKCIFFVLVLLFYVLR